MFKTILLTHAAVTFFLVGLIWTIQVVHYPLFAEVGSDNFVAYQTGHQWRITVIVLPAMILELALAALLVVYRPSQISLLAAVIGLGLVGLIWFSTMFIQVPDHNVLNGRFEAAAHAHLVASNWIRTLAWTIRGGLSLWMLAQLMTP